MTPERAHKIAIYVIMALIGAHEIAALIVRRFFARDLHEVNANTFTGCGLSMYTDQRLLDQPKHPPEPQMLRHPRLRRLQQRLERL